MSDPVGETQALDVDAGDLGVIFQVRPGATHRVTNGQQDLYVRAEQVALATHLNGVSLPPGHLRIALPGDGRGGRKVHDVVRIEVVSLLAVGH